MRILIDQSGYDLLNVGDVAMLQACVAQLRRRWPDAEFSVVCHAPERLLEQVGPAEVIGPTLARRPAAAGTLGRRVTLGLEQLYKMAAPEVMAVRQRICNPHRDQADRAAPTTLLRAIRAADVVVASGGGYLCDTWWWHGSGVLSVLALAQQHGKPTAMFGQGVGPLRHPVLRWQAKRVLPRLAVLGLREGAVGLPLVRELGVPTHIVRVTGDDALAMFASPSAPAAGDAIGINVRVSQYTGIGRSNAADIGGVVQALAEIWSAPIVALPISRYPTSPDLDDIAGMFDGAMRPVVEDLADAAALCAAARQSRVVVTASYHAAVFALGQGIPVVCICASAYYDAKFAGLATLFQGAVEVVRQGEPSWTHALREAVTALWDLPYASREACLSAAARQRAAADALYDRFQNLVQNRGPRGLVASDRGVGL
jgi:colanic acid/amylovoran biosynthesis protein